MVGGTDDWARALGRVWSTMLRQYELHAASVLVEIGPGFAPKIGYGLAALGFTGTVILVEPNTAARLWASRLYQHLLPGAEIVAVDAAVPRPFQCVNERVDLLVANHIFDDLLLNAHVPAVVSETLFAQMRPGSRRTEDFARIWQALLDTPAELERLTAAVVADLISYLGVLRPGAVVLNDYPSWQHRGGGLDAIHRHSQGVMQRLTCALQAMPGQQTTRFSTSGVAASWLVSRHSGVVTGAPD